VRAALRRTPIPRALTTEDGDTDNALLQDAGQIDVDELRDEEEDADESASGTAEVFDVEVIDPARWRGGGGARGPNWRHVPRGAARTDSDERPSDSESDERAGMYPSEYSDACERGSGSGSRYSDGEW
jgi:hypothetical protein